MDAGCRRTGERHPTAPPESHRHAHSAPEAERTLPGCASQGCAFGRRECVCVDRGGGRRHLPGEDLVLLLCSERLCDCDRLHVADDGGGDGGGQHPAELLEPEGGDGRKSARDGADHSLHVGGVLA
eukprot:scaffold41_cov90-Isochrysis_galbana.AAC.1